MNARGAAECSEITMRALFPVAIEQGSPCVDPFFLLRSRWIVQRRCIVSMGSGGLGGGAETAALAGIMYLAPPSSRRMHPLSILQRNS